MPVLTQAQLIVAPTEINLELHFIHSLGPFRTYNQTVYQSSKFFFWSQFYSVQVKNEYFA